MSDEFRAEVRLETIEANIEKLFSLLDERECEIIELNKQLEDLKSSIAYQI